MEELVKWTLTVGAASIAAYVGSLLALGKAKKEKLWIQKQEAYLSIIGALHNLIIWADEEYSANFPVPLPTVGNEKLEELRRERIKALDVLRKHVHLGGLVVSKDASAKLDVILTEYFGEESDFFQEDFPEDEHSDEVSEHYSRLRQIVDRHIEDVKRIAKEDLGL